MFVSEKHQKKGIATLLWLESHTFCKASIYTVRSSLYAVPVYEKFGFVKKSAIETKGTIQFQPMKLEAQC